MIFIAAVALAATLFSASHASAEGRLHRPLGTFGSAAQPSFLNVKALAVDAAGDLLVVDIGTTPPSIRRYNADGTPSNFADLGTNVIDGQGSGGGPGSGGSCTPPSQECDETPQNGLNGFQSESRHIQIVVDESSNGATRGNIYVTQFSANLIDIFSAEGRYLGQLTAAGTADFVFPCGVAVDPAGAVYVSTISPREVHKFVPAGNPPVNADHEDSFSVNGGSLAPCTLAAGTGPTNGFLFVNLRASGGGLFKVSTSGDTEYPIGPNTLPNPTVTTDRNAGHVLAAHASNEVAEYDATGLTEPTPVTTIEAGGTIVGTAVDPTTGDEDEDLSGSVYVAVAGKSTIDVYGPLETGDPAPEAVARPPPTEVTQTSAVLHSAVNPRGGTTEECYFEWGPAAGDYSSGSAECVPDPGEVDELVEVSAEATGLTPHATYHYRVVIKTSGGEAQGADDDFVASALPTATTEPATDVTTTTAVLNGSVNPKGGVGTECRFEYGTTTAYGTSVPCVPDPGSAEVDTPVSADLTGLDPHTSYHYRVTIDTDADGTPVHGEDETFFTPDRPSIVAQFDTQLGETVATLNAHISPNALPTSFRVEWGPDASYGNITPVPNEDIGAGEEPVLVSKLISGLTPNTTYHYRFVAENELDVTTGPDETLTTLPSLPASCSNQARRAEQVGRAATADVALLPACMALEMVSPPKKFNQRAVLPRVSADGSRVIFSSTAALAGTPGLLDPLDNLYVAERDLNGWQTVPTSPPAPYIVGNFAAKSFTPNFSRWFFVGIGSQRQVARGETQAFAAGLRGFFSPISPLLQSQGGESDQSIRGGDLLGAAMDHTQLYFRPVGTSIRLLPDDPRPVGPLQVRANAYVAQFSETGGPAPLELLARESDGTVWGGNCGASLGAEASLNISQASANQRLRNQGALATDGSLAYFSTRPTQVGTGACDPSASKLRIMRRQATPSGPEITELLASECAETPLACDGTSGGDDLYQGASTDQSRVYFTTTRQLTDSDLDTGQLGKECDSVPGESKGCDLYLYDAALPAGERLIQVSAGEDNAEHEAGKDADVLTAITGISGDGTRVYFAAQGVLTDEPNPEGQTAQAGVPNLYLYQRDDDYPNGRILFVGTLASGDEHSLWGRVASFQEAYPVPIRGRDLGGNEVGGDGHVFVFQSRASLTADDEDGGFRDVFRYDSDANPPTLERLSKAQRGGTDNDPLNAGVVAVTSEGTDFAERGRWVSEDGETVVFESADGLLPGEDDDGLTDSFLLRDDRLIRLPGTTGFDDQGCRTTTVGCPRISHDGSTVSFQTYSQLLPQDGDGIQDVYVARVGGGYPHVVPQICIPDGQNLCQGPPEPAPSLVAPASPDVGGAGNVKPARKCPKGKRKVRAKTAKGKRTRCVPKKAKRKKRKSHKRRAGR